MDADEFPNNPIKVGPDLVRHISELSCNNGFATEFKTVPFEETALATFGKRKKSLEKNRYGHIFPYDHSRVCLKKIENCDDSTYINACYIKHYNDKIYIASQGPMLNTIDDFWRMVWEQDCPQIIMLANVIENGKINCDQYWPDIEVTTQIYGEICVKLLEETVLHKVTVRKFSIVKEDDQKVVQQFHFTGWVDLKLPDTSTELLELRERVNRSEEKNRGPVLVHCRAGVGRTGTYLAVDYLLKQAAEEGFVDVVKCLHLLRHYRMNSIETVRLYIYVYHTILESLCLKEKVSLHKDLFLTKLTNLMEKSIGKSELECQFKVLSIVNLHNRSDNSSLQNVISGIATPELQSPLQLQEAHAYNVQVLGQNILVTNTPNCNTFSRFWDLVIEHDVSTIVMLDSAEEVKWKYWPNHIEEISLNKTFKLTTIACNKYACTHSSVICIENKESKDNCKTIQHHVLHGWPEESPFPVEYSILLTLYDTVRKHQDGKMLIHCLNASNRSGLFCALHHIIESIKETNCIDIFNAVRHIRETRSCFIKSMEEYQYLYNVTDVYLRTGDG